MTKTKSRSSNTAITDSQGPASSLTQETRRQMIAESAYYRAQQRGFEGGDPTADWLQAEREINDAILNTVVDHEQRLLMGPPKHALFAPAARAATHLSRAK